MVLEDGYDREGLEGKEIPPLGHEVYDRIFTQGIWARHKGGQQVHTNYGIGNSM